MRSFLRLTLQMLLLVFGLVGTAPGSPGSFDPAALGALGDGPPDTGDDAGGDDADLTDPSLDGTEGDDDTDTEGGDDDDEQLPTDPEELKKLLLAERKRRQGLLQRTGRQADELGQWRAAFETQFGGGQPGGGQAPPLPPLGGAAPQPGGALPQPAVTDPYQQALQAAGAEYQSLLTQGYDAGQAWGHYQQRTAAINQAEIDRRMAGFAQNLQSQQTQMARFESAFLAAHPELEDPRARDLFGLYLQQARGSGMYRNPVDAYTAAQQATVQYLTSLGYEAVEAHERTKAKAGKLGTPGARGARRGGAVTSPEAAIAAVNAAAAAAHEQSQRNIRSPGRPVPQ